MKTVSFTIVTILLFFFAIQAANQKQTTANSGQLYFITSSHTAFPHPLRKKGYEYHGTHYSFATHYNDSTVAIFVPAMFKDNGAVNLVFYFHGWWNSIEKSLREFKLAEQFSQSKKNAIFVFPEGAKNAADSFGGKLEERNTFKFLTNDVLLFLSKKKIISSKKIGNIVLAGHSGAYRVISFILNRGGLTSKIRAIYLFDALYDQIEKFSYWIDHSKGRFINIVTNNGGTKENSLRLIKDLQDWGMPVFFTQNNQPTANDLKKSRNVFILTTLKHSKVINPYFELFLKTGILPKIK